MASPAGRGAQVRLNGDEQAAARGALANDLVANADAKRLLEESGLASDGFTPDGSTRTGVAAEDEVLTVGGVGADAILIVETITGAYAAKAADNGKLKRSTSASDFTVTLPALPVGTSIVFLQDGAGVLTFAAGASQTISSFGGMVSTAGQYADVVATVVAANSWRLSGVLA